MYSSRNSTTSGYFLSSNFPTCNWRKLFFVIVVFWLVLLHYCICTLGESSSSKLNKHDAVSVCMSQQMLANIMDFDPRITSDGSGYGAEHGWACNFSFGYGHDIIDEETETEKCQVQALQFLVVKADAEIRDLEDELAILQCQLKWAESNKQKDPYEVCCTAFKRKIDSLTSSIQSLSNGNVLSGQALNETLEIQRPAERTYDIINALIRHNFSVPDEQMVLNEKNLLASLGSPCTDMDLVWEAAGFESSMESEEPMTVIDRPPKPAHTISQESSSDAAGYAPKDSKEGRDLGKADVEVTGRAQLDADTCTSEQRSGFLTVKPIMTPTHLQDSSEGNAKADALRNGECEEFLSGSKICESGSISLSVKTEPLVKLEDDYDMNIQHVVIDSVPKLQDHEIKVPVDYHLKETENQPQHFVTPHITYNRRKYSSSAVLKQQGRKVQKKNQLDLSGVESCTRSLTLTQLRKLGKRKSPSNAKSFGQLGSPSSEVEGIFPFPETNWQRKLRIEENLGYANTSGVLGAKSRQIHGVSTESAEIQSLEVKVSNTTREAFGSKSSKRRQIFIRSPQLGEAEGSIVTSDSANAHNVVAIAENPIYTLENLRFKLSEDPDFLNKLKVSELKAIMKQNKLRGSYKLKKDRIVEELNKQLCL